MCIICLDIEKNKLTSKDAQWALIEMANELDDEHYEEVLHKIEVLEAKDDFKKLLKSNNSSNPCPVCNYDPCDCLWGPNE